MAWMRSSPRSGIDSGCRASRSRSASLKSMDVVGTALPELVKMRRERSGLLLKLGKAVPLLLHDVFRRLRGEPLVGQLGGDLCDLALDLGHSLRHPRPLDLRVEHTYQRDQDLGPVGNKAGGSGRIAPIV